MADNVLWVTILLLYKNNGLRHGQVYEIRYRMTSKIKQFSPKLSFWISKKKKRNVVFK